MRWSRRACSSILPSTASVINDELKMRLRLLSALEVRTVLQNREAWMMLAPRKDGKSRDEIRSREKKEVLFCCVLRVGIERRGLGMQRSMWDNSFRHANKFSECFGGGIVMGRIVVYEIDFWHLLVWLLLSERT